MRRGALVLLILLLPLSVAAQEKVWRVGLLTGVPKPIGARSSWRDEILQALARHGFQVGRNLELVERYAEGRTDQLPPLAREINAAGVDAVVAVTEPAARAALAATATTPIVMVGDDPVASGLVASLARPGGRVTGIAFRTIEGDVKRLQLLSEAMPGARRLGYLVPSREAARMAQPLARAAAQLGVEVTTHAVGGPAEYATAFAALKNDGAAGVVIAASQPLASEAGQVAASAAEHRLPTICEWEYMARIGCVFGYGHDLVYAQRRVGEYVARILEGANPAELPVEQSDAWELTINLRAATALGLTIPPAILARADEVIE